MSEELSIRPATAADAPRLRELNETALREVDAFVERVCDGDLGAIESSYRDPGGAFLVGEIDGRVVAMGGLKPVGEETWKADRIVSEADGRAAELTRMRVDPAYQRRGFGSRLLTTLERRASELGFDVLVLDTTARQRGAVALYEAFDYRRVDAFDWREFEVYLYKKALTDAD